MRSFVSCAVLLAGGCTAPEPAPVHRPVQGDVRVFVDGKEWRPTSSAPGAAWVETGATHEDESAFVSVRFVVARMPRATAAEIFGAGDLAASVYRAGNAPDLEALARARPEIEVSSRPRIVVKSGAPASIANVDTVTFVESCKVEDGRVEPVQGRMDEGLWIDAVPRFARGADTIEVDLALRTSAVERPIPQVEASVPGSGSTAKVERPKLDTQTSTRHVSLELGGTCAFALDPLPPSSAASLVVVAMMTIDRADR